METEEKEKNIPHQEHIQHVTHQASNEFEPYMYHDVKTILSWHSPGRPFRKRGKQFYLTALLIALLIEIILFFFSQYLFMFVIASLVFAGFALTSIPPRNFHFRISTEGVTIEDHFYLWQELYDFYFRRIDGQDTLHIRTEAYFPGEVILTLGDLHREQVKRAMLPFLPFREYIKPTMMERYGDWLYKNFPLEGA